MSHSPCLVMLGLGADDQKVCLWSLPSEADEVDGAMEPLATLAGPFPHSSRVLFPLIVALAHYYGVRCLEYHPLAPLLISGGGPELNTWDINNPDAPCLSINLEDEAKGIVSASCNFDGSLCALGVRGQSLTVADLRSNSIAIASDEPGVFIVVINRVLLITNARSGPHPSQSQHLAEWTWCNRISDGSECR